MKSSQQLRWTGPRTGSSTPEGFFYCECAKSPHSSLLSSDQDAKKQV